MRFLLALLSATPLALAGCADGSDAPAVREIEIHIGWSEDGVTQYMTPSVIHAEKGERLRFVVTNDDDPDRDYNGDRPGKDNFHDVALLGYDGDGDGRPNDIEHEVPAGETETTCLIGQRPCPEGKDFFIATTRGTFRIICEVRTTPTHDQLGMHADFIVE